MAANAPIRLAMREREAICGLANLPMGQPLEASSRLSVTMAAGEMSGEAISGHQGAPLSGLGAGASVLAGWCGGRMVGIHPFRQISFQGKLQE